MTLDTRPSALNSDDEPYILLVEDDPMDAQLALRMLRGDGKDRRVEHVCDGEEALDFLFRRGQYSERTPAHAPKVVLLDLKLPKVDGFQVLSEIRASRDLATLPVVMVTSSGEQRDIAECYRLGANSYVQKPVDTVQFRTALQALGTYWLSVNRPPAFGV